MDTDSVVNVEATQALARRLSDPWLPGEAFQLPETWDAASFDTACHGARNRVPDGTEPDEALGRVLVKFLALAPALGLFPPQEQFEPHQAEMYFSKLRVWCFGFGHALHPLAARELARLHPASPLDEHETWEQWAAKGRDARRLSGLPLGITAIAWGDLRAQPVVSSDSDPTTGSSWLLPLAVLHVLRHARWSPRQERLIVLHRSTAISIDPSTSTSLLIGKRDLPEFLRVLGSPPKRGKTAHPIALALTHVLGIVTKGHLIPRRPLHEAPGHLLVGPAATLVADPCALQGQIAHGLAISGACVAVDGTIYDARDAASGTSDVIDWDWQVEGVTDVQRRQAQQWQDNLPRHYQQDALPSAVLAYYFPQILWIGPAHRALFDAIFACQVLRPDWPGLQTEVPILFILPDLSTPENSKHMGKSHLGKNLLHALAPQAEYVQAPPGESAPDLRAIDNSIRSGGTVGLDEWNVWPKDGAHPISQDKLCGIAEGTPRVSGRVLDNSPTNVTFSAPLVIQSKTCPLRQDVLLRVFPMWLRELTVTERERVDVIAAIKSQQLALLLRLAAVATASRFDVAELRASRPKSPEEWKFDNHWNLACALLTQSTGWTWEQAWEEMRLLAVALRQRMAHSQETAEVSGLQADLESGGGAYFRAGILWEDLSDKEMTQWHACIRTATGGRQNGALPLELLRAWADSCNSRLADAPTLLQRKAGRGRHAFDATPTVLGRRLAAFLRDKMPEPGMQWMVTGMPGELGWKFVRNEDEKHVRYGLVNEIPTHPVNHNRAK